MKEEVLQEVKKEVEKNVGSKIHQAMPVRGVDIQRSTSTKEGRPVESLRRLPGP